MHVTALLLEHCLPSSLALPLEMLSAAASQARAHRVRQADLDRSAGDHPEVGPPIGDHPVRDRPVRNQPPRSGQRDSEPGSMQPGKLEIHCVGMQARQVRADCGLTLIPDRRFDQLENTDLLLIPAFWRSPLPRLRPLAALYPWLRQLHRDTLICAVGTGSFLLAEAGLLDGHPATTHWYYCDLFQRRYPRVQLKRNYLITEAGNLYCAGSVNSVADLTVHFIERFFDRRIARAVEAQFSPEIRQPFEQHLYTQGRDDVHGDELVIQIQDLLRRQLQRDLRIGELASGLGITERTLQRRFRRATGLTLQAYLQKQRLLTARELLRTSNLTIADVASQVGYQDVSHFGRIFRQWMQQSPSAYRRAARGKLFSLEAVSG